MFNTAEELKGVLKEKYQHEYEEFMVQEAKKVFIILLIRSQLLSVYNCILIAIMLFLREKKKKKKKQRGGN